MSRYQWLRPAVDGRILTYRRSGVPVTIGEKPEGNEASGRERPRRFLGRRRALGAGFVAPANPLAPDGPIVPCDLAGPAGWRMRPRLHKIRTP
jgi:hypothetical protein